MEENTNTYLDKSYPASVKDTFSDEFFDFFVEGSVHRRGLRCDFGHECTTFLLIYTFFEKHFGSLCEN